jgi:hypothetical protein
MAKAATRHANLQFDRSMEAATLTAAVPAGITQEELADVARAAYSLVSSTHHCNCLSGVIRLVVEEDFSQAVEVNLGPAAG